MRSYFYILLICFSASPSINLYSQSEVSGLRNLTSVEICNEMIPGWNLGNSLEAIGGETNWGNPKITQTLIDSVKASGFKSVRIPVAWSKFTNDSLFTIDTTWINRVEEVINYVLKDSMYAIINLHWDGGWMQPTYTDSAYVSDRLKIMWNQIATHFKDYSDSLLFAGTNEVMVDGDYGTPTKEYYTVQNSYNQTFVNTVRATGGNNNFRHLVVQGFNTNINYTDNFFIKPNDVINNKLIVEVHYYDPYNFTLNSNSNITQWGKDAENSNKTENWANEDYADAQFNKMKVKFVDNGIGVILGEYGVIARLDLGSEELNIQYENYRTYYIKYITESIVKHGLVPMVWDNGYTENYGLGLFNRNTGEKVYPNIINAIINYDDSINTTKVGKLENINKSNSFILKQNYPNPFNPSTTIEYSISNSQNPKQTNSRLIFYDSLGKEINSTKHFLSNSGNFEFDGSDLSSGVYYYEFRSNNFSQIKKMVLLK